MNKESIHKYIVTFSVFLIAFSALGELIFPSRMLDIVGITSNRQMDFLLRTTAVALMALIPSAWAARNRSDAAVYRNVLIGLAGYMFLSSAVDLHARVSGIVNSASVLSIIFRVILGGSILSLIPKNSKTHPSYFPVQKPADPPKSFTGPD
jgi:hypothetical protein